MSVWFVLAGSGLHQACPGVPRFEIFTPLFDKVTMKFDPKYAKGSSFVITTQNNSATNIYIQSGVCAACRAGGFKAAFTAPKAVAIRRAIDSYFW